MKMPDNSKHPIIQELIRRLIQSDPAHAPEIRSPFAKGGPGRKGGSDPHVGLDVVLPNQGEVNGGHPILTSPIEPGPRHTCQRVDHPSPRKSEAIKWLLAAALATSTLLSCRASHAAQKTIEWFDDLQCSWSIKFDPKKYDEQSLRNTIAVIFNSRFTGAPFPENSPDIPIHPNTPASLRLEQFQQRCERTIRQASDFAVIDLPGIESYRKLKLEEMDDQCKFGAIKIRAASGDAAALRSYAPSAAKCSRFIDALEGKADIMTVWREMVDSFCQSNGSPAACRAHFSHEGEADAMDWVRSDVLQFGWNNCSTPYLKVANRKRADEIKSALVREFNLRFKIKTPACSD
jgi:hypothetical protein